MIKVLICEDEKRVCKLIQNIISWEELGFKIVDVAHNGTDAISKINLYNPDVVITDIRMPGCTGIEMIQQVKSDRIKFIIISGYKQFEYAQSAIKYGVEDYILKPIDKNELTNALIRIKKGYEIVDSTEQKDEELKCSKEKVRNNLVNYILVNNNFIEELDLNKINDEFNVSFKSGIYQSIYLKIFSENKEEFNHRDIFNIFIGEFTNIFRSDTYEIIHNVYKGGLIFLVNYDENNEKVIKGLVYSYLNIVKKVCTKFNGLSFILSLGKAVIEIKDINFTLNDSIDNVKYRLNYGLNTIIDIDKINKINIKGKNILGDKEVWALKNIIESYSVNKFSAFLDESFAKIDNEYHENSICIFDTLDCINNTILEVYSDIDKQGNNSEKLINKYNKLISFEVDKKVLINRYKLFVVDQLNELSFSTNKKEAVIVTKAKKYIYDNYQSPITLEEVAERIDITPTYLSTMFKKELGINFSEYIIELRIEMAKSFLKSTSLSIAEITEEIGYTDCRYFSKLFNKIVGIKPSKYRKLHSNG